MKERGITTSSKRFKDVLFALYAAGQHDESLGRLRLQKFIYLADVLSRLWRFVGKPTAFLPYKNGPYDPRIQNTVDALAFRGLVNIDRLKFRQTKNTECTYSITDLGREVVDDLSRKEAFGDDLQLFAEIALEVDRRGWSTIKTLVYADPTYDSARAANAGRTIQTDTPDANLSLRIALDFDRVIPKTNTSGSNRISRRNLIQLFFAVLDDRLENIAE